MLFELSHVTLNEFDTELVRRLNARATEAEEYLNKAPMDECRSGCGGSCRLALFMSLVEAASQLEDTSFMLLPDEVSDAITTWAEAFTKRVQAKRSAYLAQISPKVELTFINNSQTIAEA